VVAADAQAEGEAEDDQPPDIGRQRRGDRSGRKHQHLIAIDALAAQHVGDTSELHGADGEADRHRARPS
jgi:hypothetical protein